MYAQGITINLTLVAISVGIVALILSKKILPLYILIPVILIKVTIPLVYFAWFFDGSWTFIDDITYYTVGKSLLNAGYSPLATDSLRIEIMNAGTPQILYYWYNHFTQFIVGPYYYAPVFGNVFLTFVAGYYLYKITLSSGFGKDYAAGLFLFFILQWDVLTWSSFINLKDIVMLALNTALFYYVILVREKVSLLRLLTVVCLLLAFFFIRIYVPLMIIAALCLDLFVSKLKMGKSNKYEIIIFMVIGVMIYWYLTSQHSISGLIGNLNFSLGALLYGPVKMILTPRPWSISPEYSFLFIPAILHLIFVMPMLIGARFLWSESKNMRLLIIYFFLSILAYGMSLEELQGPRHRVQLLFIIASMQYRFLWIMLKAVRENMASIEYSTQTK